MNLRPVWLILIFIALSFAPISAKATCTIFSFSQGAVGYTTENNIVSFKYGMVGYYLGNTIYSYEVTNGGIGYFSDTFFVTSYMDGTVGRISGSTIMSSRTGAIGYGSWCKPIELAAAQLLLF